MRISDWSSDVCSSDLISHAEEALLPPAGEGLDSLRLRAATPHREGEYHQHDKDRHDDERPAWPLATGAARRRLRAGVRIHDRKRRLGRAQRPLTVAQHQRSEEHTSELQSLMRISYAV